VPNGNEEFPRKDGEILALRNRFTELETEVEHLEWAQDELEEMETKLCASQRETREARYTMAPADLEKLFYLAYEAANHQPNWPDGWPIGRRKWRDQARTQLAEAFGKLGFVRSADADEAQW
jgi:hypothetical protein